MIYQYHIDILLLLLAIGMCVGVPITISALWSKRNSILEMCAWVISRIRIQWTRFYLSARTAKRQNEREIRLNTTWTQEGFVLARTRSHPNEALPELICHVVKAASIHPSADVFDRYAISVRVWDQASKDIKHAADQLYYIEGGSLHSLLLTLTGEKVRWSSGCCITVLGFVVCRDIV